jgi:hypothetical protein
MGHNEEVVVGLVDNLKKAGFKAERSTIGAKPILEGVYRATLVEVAKMEDKGYGESIYAQFKVTETLAGRDSNSQFPEFKGYYSVAPEKIASKRSGLAKLINGLFSIGYEVKDSSDEELIQSLNDAKGSVLYVKGYKEQPRKKEGDAWVEDTEKDSRQGFTFMTQKNAEKEAIKLKKDLPF